MNHLAPHIGRVLRPLSTRSTQCLRLQRAQALTRFSIPTQRTRQQRYQSNGPRSSFKENSKKLFREYPYSVSLALLFILVGVGSQIYLHHVYQNYIIGAFHKYPEPVAKLLRRAIFYTNVQLEPKNAVKYYKEALRVADEVGMDPFSDEIIGVKIQLATLMEKCSQYQKAIGILEIVKRDNLKWVEVFGDKDERRGDRTRILGKTVGVSVKLGELYANKYVLEKAKAEESLVWAVETILKEKKRREVEGVKEGEGAWSNDEETGATLEALGNHYEERDLHYLATPLFLQALAFSPPTSCHTVVLMNNLSICLAQQSPPSTPNQPPISRPALVSNAREWAQKALAVAAKIQPADKTAECHMGCAVATHNLGEFAEMDGNIMEARRRFEEAKSLSKALGFKEGVENADKALKRLSSG